MACVLTAVTLSVLASGVHAGVVEPGQGSSGDGFRLQAGDPQFVGETLATRETPFEILDTELETGDPIGVTGTLTQRVVRESATGRLAFHYAVRSDNGNTTIDFEDFYLSGFAGFTTDVYTSEDALSTPGATRSADGDRLSFIADESWTADFVVRTDATDFGEGGTATIHSFFNRNPSAGPADRNTTIDTFRPLADDGGPGPTPIPLPPAAWAALATTAGFGVINRLRRGR